MFNWRAQVVATALAEREKFFGHDCADDVGADILVVRLAASVPKKSGEWIERAGHNRFAEYVSGWGSFRGHGNSINAPVMVERLTNAMAATICYRPSASQLLTT